MSVLNESIEVKRIGTGDRVLVLVASLHGDEANTYKLLFDLTTHYTETPPPNDFTLYIVPTANPDGYLTNERLNANGVDLNRNWDTVNWQPDTQGPTGRIIGGGGSAPFSEPETAALSTFLLELQATSPNPITVIFYHAYFVPDGSVLPSFSLQGESRTPDPTASALGQAYAITVNSYYSNTWGAYVVTGGALNWCGINKFICLEIELPSSENLSPEATLSHIAALDALMLDFLE